MALSHFTFGNVSGLEPVMGTHGIAAEAIAPTVSNQQTSAVAAAAHSAVRVATDTAIYVTFGINPNAATGTSARFYLPAGSVEYFGVVAGWKAAVITA